MIVASEDVLLEAVTKRLLVDFGHNIGDIIFICTGGQTKLHKRVPDLIKSSRGGLHVIVSTDLDTYQCPVKLRDKWFPNGIPTLFLFSVAIREVDAWLLADENIRSFLKSRLSAPENPETLQDAKRALLFLAKHSKSRSIRDEMIARDDSLARIGPGYNRLLREFISSQWDHEAASIKSPSLRRYRERLRMFGQTRK